eukprot:7200345-Pyramimonas_sp.AAC.1
MKLRRQCEQLDGQDVSEFAGKDMQELGVTTIACLYDLSLQREEDPVSYTHLTLPTILLV